MENTTALSQGLRFGSVNYDHTKLAEILESFLIHGSLKGKISIAELTIMSDQSALPERFLNIKDAISHGTKLFDAIMYFSIHANERPIISTMTDDLKPASKDHSEIAKALFYQGFLLLTRASTSSSDSTTIGSIVPSFLSQILGLVESSKYYADLLASFELTKMSHQWIKYIDWGNLGLEAVNRFAYLMFFPFKLIPVKDNLSIQVYRVYEIAKKVADAPPNWDMYIRLHETLLF